MTSTPRKDEVEDMEFDLVFNQPHLTPIKETKTKNKRKITGKMPAPLLMKQGTPSQQIGNFEDYLKMIDKTKKQQTGGKKRKSRKTRKGKKYSKKKRSKSAKRRKTKSRRR